MSYYVEKYYNDNYYNAGEMSSCKKFETYEEAEKYFRFVGTKYKRGFIILSEEDEDGFPQIIDEIAL